MSEDRRQSLPSMPESLQVTRSKPRPSRMSLAPSRGILKRQGGPLQDIDENNTVIGVMPVPKDTQKHLPRFSMTASQRRVSFASKRLDIYESIDERSGTAENSRGGTVKLAPPIESPIRRSPRLAAKRGERPDMFELDSSPSKSKRPRRSLNAMSPNKALEGISKGTPKGPKGTPKGTSMKSPKKSIQQSNDTLISLGSDNDEGEPIELTAPFSIRADQSPLKPLPVQSSAATDLFSNKENVSASRNDLMDSLEDDTDMSMTLTNVLAKTWPAAPLPILPPLPSVRASRYSTYEISREIERDANRPLESPKKVLMQKIASMSPRKRSLSMVSDKSMDISMDMSFTRPLSKSFNKLTMEDGPDDDLDRSDMEITRRYSQAAPAEAEVATGKQQQEEDDEQLSGSDIELTNVGQPTTSAAPDARRSEVYPESDRDSTDEDGDEMELTRPLNHRPSTAAVTSLPSLEVLESPESSDMEFTTALGAPDLDSEGEEQMELTKPMSLMPHEVTSNSKIDNGEDSSDNGDNDDDDEMEFTRQMPVAQQLVASVHDEADLTLTKTAQAYEPIVTGSTHLSSSSANSSPSMHLNTQAPLVARTQDIIRARSVNDAGYTNITVDEFLSQIDVEFMDQFLKRRRNGSSFGITSTAPSNYDNDASNHSQEPKLSEYVVASSSQLPLLNMYEFACQEMQKDNAAVLDNFVQWEKDIQEDNPVLFKEFVDAPQAVKKLMISQFQVLKSFSRQEAKATWYDWRHQLTKGLRKELERNLHKIQCDMRDVIAPKLDNVTTRFDEALKQKAELKSKVLLARQKLEALRTRSSTELQQEKREMKELQRDVVRNRSQVFAAQEKLEKLTNEAEGFLLEAEDLRKRADILQNGILPDKEKLKVSLKEPNDLHSDSKRQQFESILKCSLYSKARYSFEEKSVVLLYSDGLAVRVKENGLVSLSLQHLRVHDSVQLESLEASYRLLAQYLESHAEDLTVEAKIAYINEAWVDARKFSDSLLRFSVVFNSDISIASKEVRLKAGLLHRNGATFTTDIVMHLDQLLSVEARSSLDSVGVLKSDSLDSVIERLLLEV